MIPYKVNYDLFWSQFKSSISDLKVIGNTLITNKNNSFALYDVKEQKLLTDYIYEAIKVKPLEHKEKFYFECKKEGKYSLVDSATGKNLINNVFRRITGFEKYHGKTYVTGFTGGAYQKFNLYNHKREKVFISR